MKLSEHTIWYRKPSESYYEALPLGNGRLMAMVSGGINEDVIYINDYSAILNNMWTYKTFSQYNTINSVRGLIGKCKNSETELLLQSEAGPDYNKFVSMAKILIHSDFAYRKSKYRRELRLDKAVNKLTFCTEGKNYTRESFISRFAQIFAMRISCSAARSVSFTISLESDEESKIFMIGNTLCLSGNVRKNIISVNPEYDKESVNDKDKTNIDTPYLGALSIKNYGGTVIYSDNKIKVIDADEVILYFSLRTKPYELVHSFNKKYNDFSKQCFADIHYAQKLPYFDLINQSILEHKNYYEKCSISLEDGKYGRVSTDVRLQRFIEGQSDLALYPLMYNTGKYLAIICSQYSTNLSKIINKEYSTLYKHDNKRQLKFWPIYPCGLFECYEPFLKICKKYYSEGKIYAKEKYNIDGWLYNYPEDLISDIKAKDSNTDEINFWRVCSGWMSLILWKYYTFNIDSEFLNEIYPIIEGAAAAFKVLLVKKDDYYILPVSAFTTSGVNSEKTADYSIIIQSTIYHLFKAVSQAQDILKIKNVYKDYLPYIKRDVISIDESECNNKNETILDEYLFHILELTGAYDFAINTDINKRVKNTVFNYDDTKESITMLGWKVNMCVNLNDGEKAEEFLNKQLIQCSKKNSIYNPSDYYSRFAGVNPVYTVYSNMAVSAGMLNMLVQFDEDGELRMLPALPKDWTRGKVSNVRISGNKKISFNWEDGQIKDYRIEDITD